MEGWETLRFVNKEETKSEELSCCGPHHAQRKAFKDSRTVFYCSFFNHLTLSSFHPELEDMISDQIMTEKIS